MTLFSSWLRSWLHYFWHFFAFLVNADVYSLLRISDLASVAPRKIRKSLFTMQIFNFNLTGFFPAKQFKIPKLSLNTAKFPLIWRDFLDFQSKLLHSVNFFLQFCSTVCQFQQIKKMAYRKLSTHKICKSMDWHLS